MKGKMINVEDCKWVDKWDILGWVEYNKSEARQGEPVSQSDWNSTVMTKIDIVSSMVHRSTMRGAADTLWVHPTNSKLITEGEYYQADKKMWAGRYNVIVTKKIEPNNIFVGREEYFNLEFVTTTDDDGEYVKTRIEDANYSDEELVEYRRKLMGCVKILNTDKLIDFDLDVKWEPKKPLKAKIRNFVDNNFNYGKG